MRFRLATPHYIDMAYLPAGTEIGDGTPYNVYAPNGNMTPLDDEAKKAQEDYFDDLDKRLSALEGIPTTVSDKDTDKDMRRLLMPTYGARKAARAPIEAIGGPSAGHGPEFAEPLKNKEGAPVMRRAVPGGNEGFDPDNLPAPKSEQKPTPKTGDKK